MASAEIYSPDSHVPYQICNRLFLVASCHAIPSEGTVSTILVLTERVHPCLGLPCLTLSQRPGNPLRLPPSLLQLAFGGC